MVVPTGVGESVQKVPHGWPPFRARSWFGSRSVVPHDLFFSDSEFFATLREAQEVARKSRSSRMDGCAIGVGEPGLPSSVHRHMPRAPALDLVARKETTGLSFRKEGDRVKMSGLEQHTLPGKPP